jgi:hypothetical protein
MRLPLATCLALAGLLLAHEAPAMAQARKSAPPAAAKKKQSCLVKAGSATGITRGFAEYEALLIIRQVTGNWPVEKDVIGPPAYTCTQGSALWTCRATARVCKR